MGISKDLVKLIKESEKQGTQGYDTQAEVLRVEGKTAWVHIPGGVQETPVDLTINAKPGDIVQVRVAGGNAWLNGNASAPPTDDATALMALESASIAKTAADNAVQSAATAEQAAQEATATAESVRGIAEQAQAEAEAASTAAAEADSKATAAGTAAAAAQSSADSAAAAARAADSKAEAASTAAQAAQSSATAASTAAAAAQTQAEAATTAAGTAGRAAAVAQAAAEAAQGDIDDLQEWFWHDTNGSHVLGATSGYRNDITSSGMNIVETATETSVAEFGANGARVGKTTGARTEIDADGQRFYASDGSTQLANMGFSDLPDPVHGGTDYAPFYTFGVRIGQIGAYSFVEGIGNISSGIATHAEGSDTTASGQNTHAEGAGTTASGEAAHAEGFNTTASGSRGAHAEGFDTTASGKAAHAEGVNTTASGDRSHAQNLGTVAAYDHQTAIGKYNDNNQNNAFEIGNGTNDNNRSNAFTVAWNGDTVAAGDITDGSGNVLADKVDTSALATVATTGAYSDLIGAPTIPTALADLTSDATHRVVTDAQVTAWNNKVDKTTPLYDLDTTAATGTTDGDLYAAITALSWESEVIG